METVPEQPEETMEDSSPPVSLSRAESPPHSPSKKSSPPAKSFHHSVQHRLSPIRRPLTTYTALGSPIHPRHRTHSLGSLPGAAWNGGAPSPVVGPYSPGALSPVTGHHATNIANSSIPLLPPEPSETQRAMEAAVAKERERAKSLEEEELNMTADELRAVLKRERHRTGRIAADLAAMKATAVHAQLEAEVIEEGRINGLMRRLDTLQQEKGRIIVELEREEEMVRLSCAVLISFLYVVSRTSVFLATSADEHIAKEIERSSTGEGCIGASD